jgi:hypothetical protein
MAQAAKAAGKQRGRPFPKGVSGNPKGRPQGSKSKATIMAEAMLQGQAGDIINALIAGAVGGDPVCMRLAVERLYPTPKDRAVELPIPADLAAAGALEEAERVTIRELAAGRLTPTEAATVLGVIRKHREPPEIKGEDLPEEVYPMDLRLVEDMDPDTSEEASDGAQAEVTQANAVAPAPAEPGGAGGGAGQADGWPPGLPSISRRGF